MSKRKILAIVLVLAMVLALPVVAMADDLPKPVVTTTTTQPSTIQSVTIGGVTASYQIDGYGSISNPTYDTTQVFIRALMPESNTEESLKTLKVIIKVASGYSISGGSLLSTYSYSYNSLNRTYTINGVDLLNTSYTVIINGETYIVAAGLDDSDQAEIAIPSDDPLIISGFSYNSGSNASIYRVTVQNPCMGNPYFVGNSNPSENGWTFCNYYIKSLNASISNMSSVPIAFTKDGGASITGNVSSVSGTTNVTATANLSVSSPILTVTNSGNSRSYNMIARVATSGYIWVTYGFSFDELKTATDYYYTGSTVKTKADKIASDAAAYFGGTVNHPVGDIQVPAGSTAMDVVQAFMYSAGYSEYDPDSTYISSIYGLAAFDTTGMDGWMYTDDSNNWSYNWHLPSVGAADWYLSAGDHITWFFTTDFTAYTNW